MTSTTLLELGSRTSPDATGRILVASDGSPRALEAARQAAGVFGPGWAYTVLTVIPPDQIVWSPVGLPPLGPNDRAAAIAVARSTEVALGLPAALRVEIGFPGPAICAVAAEISATAIALGASTRSRHWLGNRSVTRHVVRHAPCDVLVTAPPR